MGRIKAHDLDIGKNAEVEYTIVPGDGGAMFDIATNEHNQEGNIILKRVSRAERRQEVPVPNASCSLLTRRQEVVCRAPRSDRSQLKHSGMESNLGALVLIYLLHMNLTKADGAAALSSAFQPAPPPTLPSIHNTSTQYDMKPRPRETEKHQADKKVKERCVFAATPPRKLQERVLPLGPPMLQHLDFLQETPFCKFHIPMPGSSSLLIFQWFNFFFLFLFLNLFIKSL